jgi:iron complex transport system substrate-binding protein
LLFSIAACNNTDEKSIESKQITDMIGRKISIPDTVKSVVGLRASSLRFLVYMDAVEMIAGVEENEFRGERVYTIAYPELKQKPAIGPMMGGDAELILKQNPDVIFMSYTTAEFADAMQNKTGIPVVVIECPPFVRNKAKVFETFSLMGKVLNKENRADSLINFIKSEIENLEKLASLQENNASVYIAGVSYRGAHGINSTQASFPAFDFVGLNNIAKQIDSNLISHIKGTFIDIEQLIQWNPDYVFIDQSGLELVNKDLNTKSVLKQNLKAFENQNVYTILPYNNYATNYELNIINAYFVGKILKPNAFEDEDFDENAKRILNFFYGRDVYNKVLTEYPAFKKLN